MKVCPICGKRFVCWPEFWPYRRGDHYICSENCRIVFDTREIREKSGWIDDYFRKKEEKKMRKITLDQKKKAVDIAIGGGDPLKYLKECGSVNPSAHWYYIKKTLKEKDPEKYARIPAAQDKKEEPKVDLTIDSMELAETDAEQENSLDGFVLFEMKDGRRRPIATCCAPSTREGVEVPDELPEDSLGRSAEILEKQKEQSPLNCDGFEIAAIRSEDLGEFYYDRKFRSIDWRTVEGNEISMSPVGWRRLMNELPRIMEILGI